MIIINYIDYKINKSNIFIFLIELLIDDQKLKKINRIFFFKI